MKRMFAIALLGFGLACAAALGGCSEDGDVYPEGEAKPEVNQPWPKTTEVEIENKQEVVEETEPVIEPLEEQPEATDEAREAD